jgi:hypothetical protein
MIVSIDRNSPQGVTYKLQSTPIPRLHPRRATRHRIKANWLKWRQASGVLCDPKVPLKLKGKFYRTAIRPDMLYGAECWPTKRRHVQQLSVAEMRMLRWICGNTRRDRVRNDDIRKRLGVAPVKEKLVHHRLRWFGYIQQRPTEAPVRSGVIT